MSNGEVLMPTGTSEAWQQAQVLAMRQLGELVAAQTKRIDSQTELMMDMRDRLIRLEAQEVHKDVEALRSDLRAAQTRIDQLEAQRDRVQGVAAFTSWLSRVAPWLLAMFAAAWAGRETLSK